MSDLAAMIAERDFIDFPTAWALQDDPRCPEHVARCSATQTDGALLCDCDAVRELWCRLRDEAGLDVPLNQYPTQRPWPPAPQGDHGGTA